MSHVQFMDGKQKLGKEAPADMEQLFIEYYDYIITFVHQLGIDWQDAPDVASELLVRFYENGNLEKFQPEWDSVNSPKPRKVYFKSYLSGFVGYSVRGIRDSVSKRRFREPLLLNDIDQDGKTWLEILAPATSETETEPWLPVLRARIENNDLLIRVLNGVENHVDQFGTVKVRVLSADLGMSMKAVKMAIVDLQSHILDIQMDMQTA